MKIWREENVGMPGHGAHIWSTAFQRQDATRAGNKSKLRGKGA